jgi:hypothetical protein
MRFILMFCVAALVLPTPAAGQTDSVPEWPVAAGSRVRVLSPVFGRRYVTGDVVAATRDTLLFRAARDSTSTAIITPNIVSIEIARGTHTNTARGAFGGFVLGALVGAAIGAVASPPPCTNCLDFSQGASALGTGFVGGVVGALVGAAIGKRPSDTWVPVTVPRQ